MRRSFSTISRFQSTLPVWGATAALGQLSAQGVISIHAPRVGSDHVLQCGVVDPGISIHAPRVGSDDGGHALFVYDTQFQSTLPVWGATLENPTTNPAAKFQSTLPVWGATSDHLPVDGVQQDFNPRSPCGERPASARRGSCSAQFQSTLPVWGATRRRFRPPGRTSDFNPRSPCGERPRTGYPAPLSSAFQSTLPVWGATIAGLLPFFR